MATIQPPAAGVTADDLTAIEAGLRADETAYMADLERLVNIDCGSYTPAGVDEVGAFVRGFMSEHGARDRKSTRLNSSHIAVSRMPSSA